MKRWFFIIGGITITLLIIAWVYLLLNGTPTREELFNAFSFGDTEQAGIVIDENPIVESPSTDTEVQALRQLTVRRVVGYSEVISSSSTPPLVYFTEAGTGHIYAISPDGQNENRISNLTLPQANEAAISLDGAYAVIKTTDPSNLTIVTLPNGTTELSSFTLNEPALPGFSITQDGVLLFTSKSSGELVGKRLNLKTKAVETLFTLPFIEGMVVWGKTSTSSHYVYPKTNRSLEGFLYEIKKSSLARLPIAGFGLSALSDGKHTIYMTRSDNAFFGYLYNHAFGATQALGFTLLPEKCSYLHTTAGAICGYSDQSKDVSFPDNWYKGVIPHNDNILVMAVNNNEVTFTPLITPLSISGRELDIISPKMNRTDTLFYFINKNDQSLWVLEPARIVE